MLEIDSLNLGRLRTNCYVVRNQGSSKCIVIDPGAEGSKVLSFLDAHGLTLEAILLTHGHFDHVGAVKELAATTGCRVYINAVDNTLPGRLTFGTLYYTHTYPHEGQLEVAGMVVTPICTPGHTIGSMCLLIEDCMFSGDTLFAGTCGRTDLPTASHKAMLQSLQTLRSLPGDYRVLPGHGRCTTLEQERQTNPFMQ